MRLIAVSRVLNEDDVIEAMIRHHAAVVDHHILLDNGSSDSTLEILAGLANEGFNLTVLQNDTVLAAETCFNDALYAAAVRDRGADWVLHLDADEFLDLRGAGDLKAYLASLPDNVPVLGMQTWNYRAANEASAPEANVMRRLVRRQRVPNDVWKIGVRGALGPERVAVLAGNHAIRLDGAYMEPFRQHAVRLAHYPYRSAFQWAAKAANGRLQVLAAGAKAGRAHQASHYAAPFEALMRDPVGWIEAEQAAPGLPDLIEDPAPYLGGDLTLTPRRDPMAHALSCFLATQARMARMLGDMLDLAPQAQAAAEARCAAVTTLFHAGGRSGALEYRAVLTSSWRDVRAAGAAALLAEGWGEVENWGAVWGVGPMQRLRLCFGAVPFEAAVVEADVSTLLAPARPRQQVAVFAGGQMLALWRFEASDNRAVRSVRLPAELIARLGMIVVLELRSASTLAPHEMDAGSEDRRDLALALHRIRCLRA